MAFLPLCTCGFLRLAPLLPVYFLRKSFVYPFRVRTMALPLCTYVPLHLRFPSVTYLRKPKGIGSKQRSTGASTKAKGTGMRLTFDFLCIFIPLRLSYPYALPLTPMHLQCTGDLTFVYPFIYPFRVRTPVTFVTSYALLTPKGYARGTYPFGVRKA